MLDGRLYGRTALGCGVLARDAGGAFKDGVRMLIEAIKLDRRRVWLVTGKSL